MASVVVAPHGPGTFGTGRCLQRLDLREGPLAPLGHVPARLLRRLRRRRASRRRQVDDLACAKTPPSAIRPTAPLSSMVKVSSPAAASRLSTRSTVCPSQ